MSVQERYTRDMIVGALPMSTNIRTLRMSANTSLHTCSALGGSYLLFLPLLTELAVNFNHESHE